MDKFDLILPYVNNGNKISVYYEIRRFIDEVLISGEYGHMLAMIPGYTEKNDHTVIDLGCNIGTFSLFVYDKSSIIYSIDLGKRCIQLLDRTIEENNLTKIKTFQQAIAGEDKNVQISSTIDTTDGGISIYGAGETVKAITLAHFMKDNAINHVDLLKVDIECAEREIFNNTDFPEVAPNIDSIVGEVHGGSSISSVLAPFGYKYFEKGPHFLATRL